MLELLILEFDGAFEPVVAVQVHHHAALVEALMALSEVRLNYEAEVLLPRGHLQYRSIVVAEMVIGPLPEVRVRRCSDSNNIILHFESLRLPRPMEIIQVNLPVIFQRFGYAVNEIGLTGILGGIAAGDNHKADTGQ